MSRVLKNVEIRKALRANPILSVNDRINHFENLKGFIGLNQPIRSISVGVDSYDLTYESTLEGKSMEGIEFVKNSNFFYGLPIEKIEFFSKYVNTFEEDNIFEEQTDWSSDHCESSLEEPCYYDMALVNGRFWTFAPNVSEIKEIAFQA